MKKRLRGLQRLLNKPGLSEEVRRAKEAELSSLQVEVGKHNRVQRERHFSKKYHGVKFIEKRKVERRVTSLRRAIVDAATPAAAASLEAEVREAEHDLLYIQHFPRSKKYLALFPASGADDAYIVKRRNQIRSRIVRRVDAGLPVGAMIDEEEGEEEEAGDDRAELEDDAFFQSGHADDEEEGAHEARGAAATGHRAVEDGKKARKKRARSSDEN